MNIEHVQLLTPENMFKNMLIVWLCGTAHNQNEIILRIQGNGASGVIKGTKSLSITKENRKVNRLMLSITL